MDRDVKLDYERNENCSQVVARVSGGIDSTTALYAGVLGSSLAEKLQEFLKILF